MRALGWAPLFLFAVATLIALAAMSFPVIADLIAPTPPATL